METANVTGTVVASTPENMMWIILLYILVIAVVAFVPRFVEIFIIYKHQRSTRDELIKRTDAIITIAEKGLGGAPGGTPSKPEERVGQVLDKLKGLLTEIMKEPQGTPGTFRITIAVTIILIVGIAVFHLLVFGNVALSTIGNIISALVAIVGTIAGFYFGGKSGEGASKEKNGGQAQQQNPPATPQASPPPTPQANPPPAPQANPPPKTN